MQMQRLPVPLEATGRSRSLALSRRRRPSILIISTVRTSRFIHSLGILGLCAACAVALALVFSSAALAAPQSSAPVQSGVVETLNTIQMRIQKQGQSILDEKALEHERRTDEAAELRRLNALIEKKQQVQEAIEDDATPMSAAPEVIEDDATPMADGVAAAPAAPASDANTSANADAAAPKAKDTAKKSKQAKHKSTLYVLGDYIKYIQGSEEDVEPPANAASTWFGNGDVDDDRHTYFIGHNPGVFKNVMNLKVGDAVTVWDDQGNQRVYHVYDVLVLANTANFYDYESRLAPLGETITLQTCCGDEQSVRCVMAK